MFLSRLYFRFIQLDLYNKVMPQYTQQCHLQLNLLLKYCRQINLLPKLFYSDREYFNIRSKFYQFKYSTANSMNPQEDELPSEAKMFKDNQQQTKEEKETEGEKTVSFLELFRFADKTDKILIFFGTIGAALIGTAMPMFALLWGNMTTAFGQGDDAIVDASRTVMWEFFGIGGGAFVAAWMMYACWMIAGERQAIKCRKQYLKSLLDQEIGWFDQVNQSQISSKFAADCFSFQGAIGEKVSLMIQTFAMFIAGFVIAFFKGWKMTLVTLAAIPALAIAGAIYVTAIQTKDKRNSKFYAKAGGMAEQAFSSIKTVKQMNGEQFQIEQYKRCLEEGSKRGLKFGFFAALALGIMSFSMLAAHALGFWYGSNCVQGNSHCPGDHYDPGDVLIIFFSVLMAALNLSQLSPSIKKIAEGKAAAARIFEVLDREPLIKNPENPKIPDTFIGHIRFQNVSFAYPKNKKINILNDLSLQFSAHNTALVGESGCGKSTILQLLMRFYDPDQGVIYLDGINLKDIDLGWLRSKIGYVGQEPVLFAMSIKENLLFGKQDATDEQINEALKQAEAIDFVRTLDDGINTFVGSGGGQLSGGQKQRIAIARALLRNPQILLLDEATSALDRKNQKLIQKTLDNIAQSRTTITIAHRTKTIMNADIVYVLNKGVIQEKGKFKDLKRYKDFTIEKEETQQKKQPVKPGRIDFVGVQTAQKPKEQIAAKTKQEIAKQENQKLMKIYDQGIYSRLFKYCEGSQCLLIVGLLFSLGAGLVYPAFTIFFAKMLKTLFDFKLNPVQARSDANYYALIFTFIAICGFFVNIVNSSIFSIVGDKITKKVRIEAFSKIVKMPIPWFDLPKNNGGQLTTKLASDSLMVNGLTATFISILIQNIATLTAGLIIALIFQWRTALFSIGMLPLMIIVGIISQNRKSGFSDKTDEIYKQSSNMIVQCMTNIRTVESFGYEDIVLRKYDHKLEQPMRIGIKKGNVSGILFAFSQLIMFFVFGLIFFLGTVFKRDNHLAIDEVFTAIYAIFFSAMTVGNNSHFMPDIQQGKYAAARLFEIIDGQDEDQMQLREQSKMLKTPIQGRIQIQGLGFKYETRNTHVFDNFNLEISKGNKVAFVGASGCGKSTILQLIQRFYFPSSGKIFIDGVNIKDYDIHHLRASLGVVSQQPTLFNGSFKFNIQYNIPDVPMEEIIQVSRSANAFDFIMGAQKLEQIKSQKAKKTNKSDDQDLQNAEKQNQNKTGFDRSVGLKGSQISGGQKQRVAIARTLLRRPKVLLLDEATSALDSKNEEIVQKALDRIMEGRTTISVAHRIDTIKNSDQINVFQRGVVVESGKYQDLVNKKGYFYNLERGTQFL